MFSKAQRFAEKGPDDLPGPGAYNPQSPTMSLAYKKGAIYEKADRFKEKGVDGGDGWVMSESGFDPRASTSGPSNSTATAVAAKLKQAQARLEEKLAKADTRVQELTSEKGALQIELTNVQTECRLALQREAKLKTSLEKSSASKEKSKLVSLQAKVDELSELHESSKRKRQVEISDLQEQVRRRRLETTEVTERYEGLLKEARGRSEEGAKKADELKKALAHAEKELRDSRERMKNLEKAREKDLVEEKKEVERLKMQLAEAQEKQRKRLASMEDERSKSEKANREERDRLRAQLDDAQRELRRGRDTADGKTRALADAETKLKAAQTRTKDLERRVEEGERNLAARTKDWDNRGRQLKLEVESAKAEAREIASHLEACERRLRERDALGDERARSLEEEVQRLRDVMQDMADAAGAAASGSVPKQQALHLEEQLLSGRLRLQDRQRCLREREDQIVQLTDLVRQVRAERDELRALLDGAQASVKELLEDRKKLRFDVEEAAEEARRLRETQTDEAKTAADQREEREVLSAHARIASEAERARVSDLQSTVSSLSALVATSKTEACTSANRVRSLETDLSKAHEELVESRKVAASLTEELREKEQEAENLRQKWAAEGREKLKAELGKKEEALTVERENCRRIGTSLANAKAAEAGLRDEIVNLQTALSEAQHFQEAYHSLADRISLLIKRNALAEEESRQLSELNAELVGHANPYQRIRVVDNIRRELDDTKKKLLQVTQERDSARTRANDLLSELDSYRSIDAPLGSKPATKLTRVSRSAIGGALGDLTNTHHGLPFGRSASVLNAASRGKKSSTPPEQVMNGGRGWASVGPGAARRSGAALPSAELTEDKGLGMSRQSGLLPIVDEGEMTLDELAQL